MIRFVTVYKSAIYIAKIAGVFVTIYSVTNYTKTTFLTTVLYSTLTENRAKLGIIYNIFNVYIYKRI